LQPQTGASSGVHSLGRAMQIEGASDELQSWLGEKAQYSLSERHGPCQYPQAARVEIAESQASLVHLQ
jgi:hypothetical protein